MSTPSTHAPFWLASGRIPCLDGLRAVAILLVLYAHGHYPGDSFGPLPMLKGRCGFLGVQVFFVLSGFLITTLMLREIRRTGRVHLGHFYLRRTLRIVPAYAVYVALVAILAVVGFAHLNGRHWLAVATYTVNFLPSPVPNLISQFWSLAVEEHFYLLWPLLVAVLPLRWCRLVVPACLALALGLRWLLLFTNTASHVDVWTFTRIDDIAVGCGVAFLAHDPKRRYWLDSLTASRRLVLLLLIFAVSQVCISRVVGGRLFPSFVLNLLIGLANNINTLTIVALMWAILTNPASFVGRLLNNPVAMWLGAISYSLYLWHLLFCGQEPTWLNAFPLNLVFMLLIATLSYQFIEKPLLAVKDRWTALPTPAPEVRISHAAAERVADDEALPLVAV